MQAKPAPVALTRFKGPQALKLPLLPCQPTFYYHLWVHPCRFHRYRAHKARISVSHTKLAPVALTRFKGPQALKLSLPPHQPTLYYGHWAHLHRFHRYRTHEARILVSHTKQAPIALTRFQGPQTLKIPLLPRQPTLYYCLQVHPCRFHGYRAHKAWISVSHTKPAPVALTRFEDPQALNPPPLLLPCCFPLLPNCSHQYRAQAARFLDQGAKQHSSSCLLTSPSFR